LAPDVTVLRAVGVESEMELAYAGLHQLCGPLLEQLDRLPPPQRQALEIVFGLSGGPPPDRFLVGLGVLSLLSDAAHERALLCVVDDAQWLDQASALALPFVARRLMAEPIGIVFATREPDDELRHLSELELHGLVIDDARALLQSAVRFSLDERVRERIVAETRGNPLALLELPRGLTATELAGGFGLPETHALTGRIEQSFVRRLQALPEETRRLLLVAAAEPVGDPVLLWRAAEHLGIEPRAVEDAELEGLVAVGERVIFRHPLVRSAIYGSATTEDRRAVHVALAEATDRDADPDRWAWHLAAAAAGPDEHVAVELERSAGRAQARGGMAAAAAFLQRAVVLTQDPGRRAERALSAAQKSLQAGAFDGALRLVATAEVEPLDESQRARVALLRGHVAFASGSEDAPSLLLKAATGLEPFDMAVARETYLNAWGAAGLTAHLDRGGSLTAISRAIRALPSPVGDRAALDLLLDGLGLLAVDGYAAAVPMFRRAATVLAHIPVEDVLRWGWASATASMAIWDDEGMRAISVRQVDLVRDAGELAQLPIHLSVLAYSMASTGDFPGAAALLAELDNVTAATGTHIAPYALLKLRALQGRETEASAPIAGAAEKGFPHAYLAAAVLQNGLARYEEAAYASRKAAEATFEPWACMWALPELVEAAARAGDRGLACDALDRLTAATHSAGTDWALGLEARCRALVSEGADADGLYRAAIERLGRTVVRPELARAHLLYGEWLRRGNRRADARAQLAVAHELFTSIGMEAFAERTRRELVATGGRVRKRTVETTDELTAQEWQVALLARDGMSNSDIGARLFLSQHTVAYHLRKVFSKLGISSRRELAAALPSSESELAPA
jgi:DNA-binding CsgD family transcriptional regulator